MRSCLAKTLSLEYIQRQSSYIFGTAHQLIVEWLADTD
jgi:hypothetical protein